jgi:HEAT repeat protein
MMEKEPAQKQTARAVAEKPVTVPAIKEQVTEMAAIDQPSKKEAFTVAEPSAQKQVLFARLNDMESTSQRLKAAAAFDQITNTDHDIVDALVKTMNTDPSTNVRLAALDALGKFSKETYVKKKLLTSLGKQTDPMVQISLIELLTRMRESSILNELDKLVNDGNTMDAVKDRAYSSIFKLRSS